MVDSISSAGQSQNILSIDKSKSSSQKQKSEEVERGAPVDEVEISKEAKELAQIEKQAQQASEQLSSEPTATLSSNLDSLNKLV